ncbi:MAG: flavodoxin family protein, partial [Clostridia bacterium]|nr:flavodoxin family protein [Clostridia bacterium]
GKMKINGCLACEYCHGKGAGQCIQKDDLDKIMPAYKTCDMIVFASPIYYFAPTAQLEAALQRVYCIGKPAATKSALLLSSGSGAYDAAIAQYKTFTNFAGIQDLGILTATGAENKSEAKLAEITAFAEKL